MQMYNGIIILCIGCTLEHLSYLFHPNTLTHKHSIHPYDTQIVALKSAIISELGGIW